MAHAEEELAVEVGEVNCVKVDLDQWGNGVYNEDFFDVMKTKGFEEFAADATCSNEEGTGVFEFHRWW
jgi:hypothetical protein